MKTKNDVRSVALALKQSPNQTSSEKTINLIVMRPIKSHHPKYPAPTISLRFAEKTFISRFVDIIDQLDINKNMSNLTKKESTEIGRQTGVIGGSAELECITKCPQVFI